MSYQGESIINMAPLQLTFIVPVMNDLIQTDVTLSASVNLKDLAEHDHPAGAGYRVRDIKAQIRSSGIAVASKSDFVIDDEIFRNDHIITTQQLRQPITLAPPQSDLVEITLRDSEDNQYTYHAPWDSDLGMIQKKVSSLGIDTNLCSRPNKACLMDTYLSDKHTLSDFDLGESENIIDVFDVFCKESNRIKIRIRDQNGTLGFFVHPDEPIRYALDEWVCSTGRSLYDFRPIHGGKAIDHRRMTETYAARNIVSGSIIEMTQALYGGGGFGEYRKRVRKVHIPQRPSVGVGTTKHSIYFDFVIRSAFESSGSVGRHDVHFDDTSQTYISGGGYWVEEKPVILADGADRLNHASDRDSDEGENEGSEEDSASPV